MIKVFKMIFGIIKWVILVFLLMFSIYWFFVAYDAYKSQTFKGLPISTEHVRLNKRILCASSDARKDARKCMDVIVGTGEMGGKGEEGKDYISITPPRQGIIRSKDKKVNNQVMYTYFKDNMLSFNIPNDKKSGYIMIITNQEIPENRDFILGIDGVSKGIIRKSTSLSVYNLNEYLYRLDDIDVMVNSNWKSLNLYDFVKDGKLSLNVFVGDPGTYVEKIIIFFK